MPTIAKRKPGRPRKVRIDPPNTSPDYSTSYVATKNCDPGRKYVGVDPNNQHESPAKYQANGYKLEIYEEGGPQFVRFTPTVGKPTPGPFGTVMMSIDLETWNWNEAKGQKLTKMREDAMIQKRGARDPFRGIAGDAGLSPDQAETMLDRGSNQTVQQFRVG